jgi:hypothetical protein
MNGAFPLKFQYFRGKGESFRNHDLAAKALGFAKRRLLLGPGEQRADRLRIGSGTYTSSPSILCGSRGRRRGGLAVMARLDTRTWAHPSPSAGRSVEKSTDTSSCCSWIQPSIGGQSQLCFIAWVVDFLRPGALPCWTRAFMIASMLI